MSQTVVVIVEIPIKETLTSNQREHWAQRSRRAKSLRLLGKFHTQHALKNHPARHNPPVFNKAHCVVDIEWPDNRRRDAHNWMPTIKHLIDGCVDAGILPDDSDKHLIGPDIRPTTGTKTDSLFSTAKFKLTFKETQ